MDGVAYLIEKNYTEDDLGQQSVSEEKRIEIMVSVGNVSRSEWFEAGRNGLKPSIMLTTAAVNYSGEEIIEFDGVRYGIYRTYIKGDTDEIELYLEKKAGV